MTINEPEVVVVNEDKIQAEFEAWAGSKKFGLSKGHFKKDEDGEYLNFPTQCYWDVWQASRTVYCKGGKK